MSSESQIMKQVLDDAQVLYSLCHECHHIPCPSGCERRTETGTETDTLQMYDLGTVMTSHTGTVRIVEILW